MLKLNLKPEPFWLEIGGGIRVKVPPLDTAILRAVEYLAWQSYAAIKAAANQGDETAPLDQAMTAKIEGAFKLARVRALASYILAWEGVAAEDGMPLAPTAEALDAFAAHPLAGTVFERAYDATVAPLVAEGNGFAATSNGGGAEATATAEAASPPETEGAPAAPASSTRRKAAKE